MAFDYVSSFPFIYGNDFYDKEAGEIFFFFPNILTDGFICREYAMIILAYVGIVKSIVLIIYLLRSTSGVQNVFLFQCKFFRYF